MKLPAVPDGLKDAKWFAVCAFALNSAGSSSPAML